MTRYDTVRQIQESGIVGIVRAMTADAALVTSQVLLDAGVSSVEVSLTTPGALAVVEQLTSEGRAVGAGTVLDEQSVVNARNAGARFIVAPTVNLSVIRAANRYGLAVIPGAATATEALAALEAGADLVKLFPASAYGPGAVRDLLAALPQLPLVPTGGVSIDEAAQYIAAGSVAVGMGATLVLGTPAEVKERVTKLEAMILDARP